MKNIKFFLFLFSFLIFTCYDKNEKNPIFKLLGVGTDLIPDNLKVSLFSVELSSVLENTAENVISPMITDMSQDMRTLKQKADTYQTTTTESNLTELQESWKKAKKSVRRLQTLYLGNPTSYYSLLDPYMVFCPHDTTEIKNALAGSQAIDLDYLKNLSCKNNSSGNEYRNNGLDTLEYLIFDDGNGNSTATLINNANKTNSRRTDYIKALGEFFIENADKFKKGWEDSLISEFESGQGFFTSKTDSMSKIVTEMHDTLRAIADYDIGNPGGFRKAPNDKQDLNKLISKYSNYSLNEIQANIEGIDALFNGVYDSKGNEKKSISYYLSTKNKSANEEFSNVLQELKTKINRLIQDKKTMRKLVENQEAKELYDLVKKAKNIAFNEVIPTLGGGSLEFETDND